MKNENKKYLLFDNDGVLVETEKWYFQANVKALKLIDINLKEDVYQKIMAKGGNAWEVALEQGVSEDIINNLRIKRDIYYQDFLKTKDLSIKNVEEVLKKLEKKYKMAIVTTSRRVDFELIHQKTNILSYMDFSLCLEDYKYAKPHAQPYLSALKRFNAKKEDALVIEDSQRGLSSANNAGISCIIVKNDFTKTHDFSSAKYFINSFGDLLGLLNIHT